MNAYVCHVSLPHVAFSFVVLRTNFQKDPFCTFTNCRRKCELSIGMMKYPWYTLSMTWPPGHFYDRVFRRFQALNWGICRVHYNVARNIYLWGVPATMKEWKSCIETVLCLPNLVRLIDIVEMYGNTLRRWTLIFSDITGLNPSLSAVPNNVIYWHIWLPRRPLSAMVK